MIITRTTRKGERRYLVRIYVSEALGADGKLRRKFVFKQFDRKKDAEQWEREQRTAKGKGALVLPTRRLLRDHLRQWLDGPKKAVREATWEDYEQALSRAGLLPDEKRVAHPLGQRPLTDLRSEDFKAYYAELATVGMPQKGCKPLGKRSIRFLHGLLLEALADAVEARVLYANPAAGVKLPKQSRRPRNEVAPKDHKAGIQVLDKDQLACLIAAALAAPLPREGLRKNGWRWRYTPPGDRNRWGAYIVLLAKGGLRPNEALGLTREDVDWERGTVTVRHTLKTGLKGGGWKLEDPKTEESRRTVTLAPDVMLALRQHCDAQAAEVATMTEEQRATFTDHGFLFAGRTGDPLDLKNLTARHFKPLLRAAKLPGIRLYDLRHTHATLLLAAGVPVTVVSARLGHRSAKMTLDVYAHVLPGQQEQAVERLEEYLTLERGAK